MCILLVYYLCCMLLILFAKLKTNIWEWIWLCVTLPEKMESNRKCSHPFHEHTHTHIHTSYSTIHKLKQANPWSISLFNGAKDKSVKMKIKITILLDWLPYYALYVRYACYSQGFSIGQCFQHYIQYCHFIIHLILSRSLSLSHTLSRSLSFTFAFVLSSIFVICL